MKGNRSAAGARALPLWLLMALMAVAAAAQAQSTLYRCPGPQGGTTLSDRPCNAQGRAAISGYGPAAEPRSSTSGYSSYTPPLQRAPEHQAYLSPHCAALNDALRTAPNRGVRGQPLSDLYDTYRRDCAEDESAAYQQLYRERMARREAYRAQEQVSQAQREQQRNHREQCDEMQRILHAKRQRLASLSEGEKGDLQRFQESYAQRCTGG